MSDAHLSSIRIAYRSFARVTGTVLTWMILGTYFHVVFVPGRMILLVLGKDPMRRAFPGRERSYWIPRPGRSEPGSYRRQF